MKKNEESRNIYPLPTKVAQQLTISSQMGADVVKTTPMGHLVVHQAVTWEVVRSRLPPDQHSGSLNLQTVRLTSLLG